MGTRRWRGEEIDEGHLWSIHLVALEESAHDQSAHAVAQEYHPHVLSKDLVIREYQAHVLDQFVDCVALAEVWGGIGIDVYI